MDFKIVFLTVMLSFLLACSKSLTPSVNLGYIGNSLESISQGYGENGEAEGDMVIFDETTRRIHDFDLQSMTLKNSTEVVNPDAQHFLFYYKAKDFIFDLSQSHLSILNQSRNLVSHPLKFSGLPVSVAVQQQLGLFVLYDDLQSTGIIKLGSNGEVANSWVGGSLLSTGASIVSGDLNSNGQLVLSLTGGTLAVVDVEETLGQQKWVFEQFASGINDINWMAPLPNQPNLFLAKSATKIVLFNITNKSIIDSVNISGQQIQQLSKSIEPHLLLLDQGSLKIAYVQNDHIVVNNVNQSVNKILYSVLDSTSGVWTYVDSNASANDYYYGYYYNNIDYTKYRRTLKRVRLSDLLVTQNQALADNTQVRLISDYIFTLFPSSMGYVSRFSITNSEEKVLKYFNMNYLGR